MITRIEVDGFKSLRGFALDLEPLTAIVGANGAGKSNLLDALHLLSRLAETGVTEALKGGRGAIRDQFSRLRDGAAGRISISVEMLLTPDTIEDVVVDGTATRALYKIDVERAVLSSGIEDITIEEQRIRALDGPAADPWIARHPALAPMAYYGTPDSNTDEGIFRLEGKRPVTGPDRRVLRQHRNGTDSNFWEDLGGPYHSLLSSIVSGNLLSARIAEELRALRVIHFEPSKLRLPSDRAAGAALAADGSNLPTALAALAPEARAQIRADLAELIPGFRSFEVVPADEELRLEVEFTDGARVPARVLSDGTLRLVALLTLLRGSPPGALIAVEEPENGIYPGRLRALIDKLVDATTPRGDVLPPQVLLTSHSPAILAALHGRPESLVFADLVRQGDDLRSTRMRHVRASDGPERDPSTVSRREIERLLDAARPEDEA
ncbi:AAA family ATPase [Sorangium sp. So ce131]|uniref:AAA family ATPase n=1 Tax=Sorangium sp. So ce131 TaxID=3133282 RepID=UPI003F61F7C6